MTEAALGKLPNWDLTDLYAAVDSPALAGDLDRAAADAEAFQAAHAGKIAELDGAALGQAIADYEGLQERLGRVMSYAYLVYAGDMADPEVGKFFQSVQERVNAITSHLLFLSLELNRIDDDELAAKLAAPELARYAPWVRDIRVFRPYQLADDLERLLHEKAISGKNAWIRLFDETMAGLRYEIDGKRMSGEEALHLLSNRDRETRIGQVSRGSRLQELSLVCP